MNDGQLRALLDRALDGGPTLPRLEAIDRLVVELQARGWRLAHADRAATAREAAAREEVTPSEQ